MFELVDGFRCGTTHIFDGILVSQIITALDRVEHVPVPVVRADIGKCSIDPTLSYTGFEDVDIVVLDINLPGLSGFEITSRLKQSASGPEVIILTSYVQPPFPKLLLEAGAAGYLTRGCPAQELVQAVKTVASGGRHIGAEIAQKIALDMMPGADCSPFDGLSIREMEVMLSLAEGKNLTEIARMMSLSPKTVATYKYRIYDKLNTRNDVDMTRMALRYGVVALA